MLKALAFLTRRICDSFEKAASWLEDQGSSAFPQSKYVDLAPTTEADKAGIYCEAILFAMKNPKVLNIALTGPYGSGKSSIIKSFLKKYRRPTLHISLAAFVPEIDSAGSKVGRQEIERSILQQLLYGADANKLPLSRFKRIRSPGVWSILKSFFMMIGIAAVIYTFSSRENIVSGTFFVPFAPSNWLNFASFLVAITFLWVILHHIYVASFGLSLKTISLKDIEIKPAHDDQASILNRHLDEIIYFFQSTDYQLVIIEDLDRFNDADIFVTLREINSLVNSNAGIKRKVKFLYALRDDMFVNTDRTKFFEFIIPVIPIINASNSIDMVLEQGRRLELDGRLNRQFLREVSRYLNDLRLIQNIFNEYAIYVANLETDGESILDANKLLAILIYKNVYPSDFEELHRGGGDLARIFNHREELIKTGVARYKAEITEIEKLIDVGERQTPNDLRELRQIYVMALIERLPAGTLSVGIDRQSMIPLPQLASGDIFEPLLEKRQLIHQNPYGHFQQIDVSGLQSELNSQKSYWERKEEIETNAGEYRAKLLQQIRALKAKTTVLRTAKLNELLRLNTNLVDTLFESFGESGELARFLVLEGYLDDSYYQYTSLFHSGRLSPNDNKFLIQIRAFLTPEPNFPIDNPNEVIAAMRDEDFRQSYVLNVTLVDTMLSAAGHYQSQLQDFFGFVSTEFENCEDFFDAYYSSGRDVSGLLGALVEVWKGLVHSFIASPNNISHISQLLSSIPESALRKLAKDFQELSEFVSVNLAGILVNSPEISPERLLLLDFEVKDLAEIEESGNVVKSFFNEGRFEINITNLEFAYQVILGRGNLEPMRKRNFTTIRSTNSEILMLRIERDFDCYFTNVILLLEDNSEEDISAILAVIGRDNIDGDDIRIFLERQTVLLPALEEVPVRLRTMLFEMRKVEPAWSNCRAYIESDAFEETVLTGYLEQDQVREVLLKEPIPSDSASLILRKFLFEARSLSDVAYRQYIRALPNQFKKPPEELEPNKLGILINEGKITFTQESFGALEGKMELQVLFVAENIDKYLVAPDALGLDDSFLEKLLGSKIDDVAKLHVIELMDLGDLAGHKERSGLIGQIIHKNDADISGVDGSIAQSLVLNSRPLATQIYLFNKYQSLLTDDGVRSVLANLPAPFSELKTGHKTPKLQRTPENLALVKWLESRKFISSWSESGLLSDEIKVNLFRR